MVNLQSMNVKARIIKGVEFQADGDVLLVTCPVPGQIRPDVWRVPADGCVVVRTENGQVLMCGGMQS